uniref:Immunoglobulin domain-containing protein n=1 Tax=Moschus moschiferus TaxID=68415 RepID=A0A8C6FRB5_MOSMO
MTHNTGRIFIKLFPYYSVCVFMYVSPVKTSLPVLVDTKAVLTCPPVLWPSVLVVTWEIVLRGKLPCFRAYRRDTNQTTRGNCTDKRITWASRPHENPALQIDPVAITHDGNYKCQIVTSAGNFHHEYHLQVLGAPEVSLVLIEKGTVVCKEVSEKLAAQISRTPEGDWVTEQEPYWGNGLPCASCFVSHLTGTCQAPLSFTISQSLLKLMCIESVVLSNHLVLCHPLLLLPSIFPSIRVFSNESALCIRWPQC